MLAAVAGGGRRPGPRLREVAPPGAPTGSQLLVRVAASSVNGTDLGLVGGGASTAALLAVRRRPLVLGFDVAGVVEACGPEVTAFEPGDHVVALLGHGGGGQAERVLVGQGRAALAPASLPLEQAAALPLAGLTALQALFACARLRASPGARPPRVLVVGAAGGIGSFGVQLAALTGAHVSAVTTADRADFVRDLGADEVLDRRTQDPLTSGRRWDVVLDAPAALSLDEATPVLAEDGVLVSTHPISADALRALATAPLPRRGPRFAAVRTQARSQDLSRLGRLVDEGRLRVPIFSTHPIQDVAAAHRSAGGGGVRGKVVVRV